jgi:hypothetical protein
MYLSEERSPDRLNLLDARSLDQSVELVGLYLVNPIPIELSQGKHTVISTLSSARMRAA